MVLIFWSVSLDYYYLQNIAQKVPEYVMFINCLYESVWGLQMHMILFFEVLNKENACITTD